MLDKTDTINRLYKTIEKIENGELAEVIIIEDPVDDYNIKVAYTHNTQSECQNLLDLAKIIVG